jgi:steroid delta-isomerase-like uncharacterized protein
MSTEANKAAVRHFIEYFNRKDVTTLSQVYSASYVLDFPGGPKGQGVEDIQAATREFITAFPDLHFSTGDVVAEGDRVAWLWTMRGTHQANLGPFPAGGRPVTLTGLSVICLSDSKIVEDHVRTDMVGLLQQIGVIPAPDPASL